jgi:hypothetical protein
MSIPKTKITTVWVKTNYIVTDFKLPSNMKAIRYVRKEIISKQGNRNLLTLAVTKDSEGNTKLIPTSFWRPVKSKSAQAILREYLKKEPKKVKFLNQSLKEKYLHESKSVVLFLEYF